MSQGDSISHLSQVMRIVQMAYAATIRAAEARHGQEPLSNIIRNATLQIQRGFGNEDLLEAGNGQEIVDVPPKSCSDAFRYLDMAIYASQAAWPSRRACVRIEASGKVNDAKGSDSYLPCLRQQNDECINSRLISLRLHGPCSGWQLFELDAFVEDPWRSYTSGILKQVFSRMK